MAGAFAACGGKEESSQGTGGTTARGESGSADAGALPEAAKGTASIKGVAKVSGTAETDQAIPPEDMAATDPFCAQAHTGPVGLQEYVISANGEVADVFVYVKEGVQPSKPPGEQAVLDQKGCMYVPKVLGVQTGQVLHITSSDDTSHNVNCQSSKNRGFNRGFANKQATYDARFQNPEVLVTFKCDIHPWMYAYAGVVNHPFFAISGKDGSFEIKNLPAGNYVVEAVHKKLGTQTSQQITVADGASQSVDFTFPASGASGD
jgi:plastocyanin